MLRRALLGVAFVLVGHAVATVFVPPFAVERAAFYVYQTFPAALRNFQPQGTTITQAIRVLIATATGTYIAHEVYGPYGPYGTGVLRVVEEYLEDLAHSVVDVKVWGPREAAIRDAYRDLRASHPWLRERDAQAGITDLDYVHGIHLTGLPFIPSASAYGPNLEAARAQVLAGYESWISVYPDWTGWLLEGAAAHGYTGLRTGEQWSANATWYTEGPEILVSYVRRFQTQEAWAVGSFAYVRPTPAVVEVVSADQDGYEVWAFPESVYFVFAVPWIYRITPDLDWCRDVVNWITGVGFYFVKLTYDHFQYASPVGPVYKVADAGSLGAVFEYRGRFPRADGDGRSWYYQIRRLSASAEGAMSMTAWDAHVIGQTWVRICSGKLTGVDPGVLPWDVQGAPDYGTALRQRDGALVWWIVRPVEALRAVFVPQVSLGARLESLSGLLAERFPWSVYYALRVPPAVEVSGDVPCFVVGNGYELCPNDAVVRAVGLATRLGFGLVAMVGVVWWLGRRLSPTLRL